MPEAWDTTLLSRVRPGSATYAQVVQCWASGTPVATTAHSIHEVAFGWTLLGSARGDRGVEFLMCNVQADAFTVLPFSPAAALLAGELRAAAEHPPHVRHRDRRPRVRRSVGWIVDLMIAATAYANGHAIRTANVRDFEEIARLNARLIPDGPALAVLPG